MIGQAPAGGEIVKKTIAFAAALLLLILLVPTLASCGDESKKVTKQIVSIGSFEDAYGDVLTFREDGTFDLDRKDETYAADTSGAWTLETSGTYTYQGNWGRTGKVRYFIYRLEGVGYFVASGEDGYWYRRFGGETSPVEADIRNGLAGTEYKPARAAQ